MICQDERPYMRLTCPMLRHFGERTFLSTLGNTDYLSLACKEVEKWYKGESDVEVRCYARELPSYAPACQSFNQYGTSRTFLVCAITKADIVATHQQDTSAVTGDPR